MFIVHKYFFLIKNDSVYITSVLLFETVFCEHQKQNREIKQATLVNIVLDAVKKRTHESNKLLHPNAFFWIQYGPKET